MKPFQLVLIGCSDAKLTHAAPARDLYTSQLFTAAKRWAIANGDAWGILSAKFGVVWPDDVVEPYDARLGRDKHAQNAFRFLAQASLSGWRRRVGEGIQARVAVLAGRDYADPLRKCGAIDGFVEPMRGLGIGHRLQFLSVQ